MASVFLSLVRSPNRRNISFSSSHTESYRFPPISILSTMALKAITSPVPESLYPALALVMLSVGLVFTASFFIYASTTTRLNLSIAKEITAGAVACVFLGTAIAPQS